MAPCCTVPCSTLWSIWCWLGFGAGHGMQWTSGLIGQGNSCCPLLSTGAASPGLAWFLCFSKAPLPVCLCTWWLEEHLIKLSLQGSGTAGPTLGQGSAATAGMREQVRENRICHHPALTCLQHFHFPCFQALKTWVRWTKNIPLPT